MNRVAGLLLTLDGFIDLYGSDNNGTELFTQSPQGIVKWVY